MTDTWNSPAHGPFSCYVLPHAIKYKEQTTKQYVKVLAFLSYGEEFILVDIQ